VKEPHEMQPGNRYARQAETRRTLAHLIASKTALVAICQWCKHRRLLFPAALASHPGVDFKVADVPKHLRCAGWNRTDTAKAYESSR
jgi:hypothetical protein